MTLLLLLNGGKPVNVAPGLAAPGLSGFAPTVSIAALVTPGTGSFIAQGYAPTVQGSPTEPPHGGGIRIVRRRRSRRVPVVADSPVVIDPSPSWLEVIGLPPTVTVSTQPKNPYDTGGWTLEQDEEDLEEILMLLLSVVEA